MNRILDLDSKSAVTIFSSVTIPHVNPREELGLVDLENYISQAIWKTFDSCRSEAASRLEVNEVDLLLTDARIIEVKIDGHPVINPHGFTGKELQVLLLITIVKRDKFIEEAEIFEGGSIRAYLLTRKLNLGHGIYIEIGDNSTTVFLIGPLKIGYLSEFEWGYNQILAALKEELGISSETAKNFYLRYIEDKTSSKAAKKLDKIFYNTFSSFVNGSVMAFKNFLHLGSAKLPPLYLKSFFPLPASVYQKKFLFDGRRLLFLSVGEDASLEDFTKDNVHHVYRELNQLAKRRIKWLMPTS